MPFPISGPGPLSPLPVSPLDAGSKKSDGFGAVLDDAIHKVDGMAGEAAKSVERFLSGEDDDLHKTIMSTQRADLAGELFLQVRNKVVAAYQEIMRMQV